MNSAKILKRFRVNEVSGQIFHSVRKFVRCRANEASPSYPASSFPLTSGRETASPKLLPAICIGFRKPIKIAPQTELSRVARLVKPEYAVTDGDSVPQMAGSGNRGTLLLISSKFRWNDMFKLQEKEQKKVIP